MTLLPHQYELLQDTTTPILGLVSGYGAGKTFAVARKAVQLAVLNPGCDGIITEPTFPLLDQILIPELKKALEEMGVPFKYTNGVFTLQVQGQEQKIIPKSMESWERLIGINAAWVILDEFDTTKKSIALQAYSKLLGRLRVGTNRQMVIVSTPEGFSAMYEIFVTNAGSNKKLIRASTLSNYHLPREYIENMIQEYPEELIKSYLNGEFTNLTSGAVYRFDRILNDSDSVDDHRSPLLIGMDFNIEHTSAVLGQYKDGVLKIQNEFKDCLDTQEIIEKIQDYTKGDQRPIIVYPDAAGQQRQTSSQSTNHKLLQQAGFQVRVQGSNPKVQDRVNTVNSRLQDHSKDNGSKTRLFICTKNCPELTKGLEQQVYRNGAPDKTTGIDHQLDALGYLVTGLMPMTSSKRRTTNYEVHANE